MYIVCTTLSLLKTRVGYKILYVQNYFVHTVKPRLEQQPSISPDGSVAHFSGTLAPPLVKSESFEVESVAIITKSGKDSWENLEERTVHTESIMIPQQQPSDRRSRSRSTHVSETQPLTGAASSERASLTFSIGEEALNPPSLPLRIPKIVSLPVQRTDTSEARMVVKYKGGMKTESASLFFPVPSLGMLLTLSIHFFELANVHCTIICIVLPF